MPSRQTTHLSGDTGRKVPPKLWEAVDWNQTDVAIARQLGCTRQNVYAKRLVLGRRKPPTIERYRRQFATLPRGLSVQEISQRLGIGKTNAWVWCERLGHEVSGYRSLRKARAAKFASFPPGLTYKQIARRLKVSIRGAQKWAHVFGYRARLAFWAMGPHGKSRRPRRRRTNGRP
jgi:transposase-like protein